MDFNLPEIVSEVRVDLVAGALALLAAIVAALLFQRRRARRAAAPPLEEKSPETASVAAASPWRSLRDSLSKTRQGLLGRLQSVWSGNKDAAARLAELEEVLIGADVGVKTAQALLEKLRPRAAELADGDGLRRALGEEMRGVLREAPSAPAEQKPHVILVAGVNGVGKTTTIGKLGHRYRQAGKKVIFVAADTFRAAASEQLQHWAQRIGADCVHHQAGADPSAVAFDGIAAGVAREADIIIVDTAGRLHVKTHLIEELKKVVRVIQRQIPEAPHEVLLVVDATTGQNAINQARVFEEALSLTGIVLTKLDGTAKGGAVFAVRAELGVPIRWVGLGERPDDLQPFDAGEFVDALLAER